MAHGNKKKTVKIYMRMALIEKLTIIIIKCKINIEIVETLIKYWIYQYYKVIIYHAQQRECWICSHQLMYIGEIWLNYSYT